MGARTAGAAVPRRCRRSTRRRRPPARCAAAQRGRAERSPRSWYARCTRASRPKAAGSRSASDTGRSEPYHTMNNLVILAPNWLGDAVMAQPAIADLRRALPDARLVVAARREIAALFALVAEVDEVTIVERGIVRDLGAELRDRGFEAALLLPNSMHAALVAKRAGIAERWGYRTDWRGALLTRAADPPSGLHQ